MREPIRLRGWHYFAAGILVGVAVVTSVLVVQRLRRDESDPYGVALALICDGMHHDYEQAWKELSKPGAEQTFQHLFSEHPPMLYPLMQVIGDAQYVTWCGSEASGSADLVFFGDTKQYVHDVLATMPDYTDGHYPVPFWEKHLR